MMHGEPLVIVLVLVLGCAAFFFGVICLIWRAIAWIGGGVLRVARPNSVKGERARVRIASAGRVCPREQCRRVEPRREARYCAQCGSPLT